MADESTPARGQLDSRPRDATDDLVAAVLGEALQDQRLRQERLRQAREFTANPRFLEMRETAVVVSDDEATLQGRRRDLDYRIDILESLLALLREEQAVLDRAESRS